MSVTEHVEKITPTDLVITPGHADRTASPEFLKSVKRLKEDGHYVCWVTELKDGDKYEDGEVVDLQVHHFAAEWSEQSIVDYDRIKEFVETFDIYGYGKLLKNQPITTVDDIRCLMVIGQRHHTGVNKTAGNATGIHNLVFPMWVLQKLAKKGDNPVPQEGETIEEASARI